MRRRHVPDTDRRHRPAVGVALSARLRDRLGDRLRSRLRAPLVALLGCVVLLGAVLLGAGLVGAGLVGAGPAAADSGGYRYWSFWTQSEQGEWRFAQQGPAGLRPADGEVVGFRFTASPRAGEGTTPRPAGDFAAICADTDAASGQKRVALVIDHGTAADAPSGEKPPKARTTCARVPAKGSAADALAAEAPPLRYDSSALLCAIDGYPKSGCGERISGGGSESETSTESEDDDGTATVPLLVGVAVVVLLAGGAAWQVRRRRP